MNTKPAPQNFHPAVIIAVITGKMVSPTGLRGMQELLEHMTGEEVFTHDMLRHFDRCGPVLAARYPQLAEVNMSTVEMMSREAWLARQVERFGEALPVEPL